MRIEHIAIWAEDIELLRTFYMQYFNMLCGEKYYNPSRNFTSYFLHFREGGARIELMHKPDMDAPANRGNLKGLAHFSISVGSREAVDALTGQLFSRYTQKLPQSFCMRELHAFFQGTVNQYIENKPAIFTLSGERENCTSLSKALQISTLQTELQFSLLQKRPRIAHRFADI